MKRTFLHPLARLRERLGDMPQKQLADLAGCSTATIQAVELLKLKLSSGLAFKISQATGISYDYLLAGDPNKAPVNHNGQPYSEADLIRAQDEDLRTLRYHELYPKVALAQAYFFLKRVLESEQSNNWAGVPFFLKRVESFVRSQVHSVPALQNEVYRELKRWWDENVKTGRSYPKSFLTPLDTRAFQVMKSDADEGERAFEEYQQRQAKLGPVWKITRHREAPNPKTPSSSYRIQVSLRQRSTKQSQPAKK
jgi:transcriptional regulator with XRE-family HTH domain